MNKTSRMIAKAIKEVEPLEAHNAIALKGMRRGVELCALSLCEALGREYPAFDKAAFLRSCALHRHGVV